jgi:hypothetical protein
VYARPVETGFLEELKSHLRWHASTTEPLDAWFNRQLRERQTGHKIAKPYRGPIVLRLVDEDVLVLEERWPLARLVRFPRWHERDKPKRLDVPLAILREWDEEEHLIDGQTRINHWRKIGDVGAHRVLLIQPRRHMVGAHE